MIRTEGERIMGDKCETCGEDERQGKSPVRFKQKHTTCFVCKKQVKQVLDLHHTNADICSLDCEAKYWLDILY